MNLLARIALGVSTGALAALGLNESTRPFLLGSGPTAAAIAELRERSLRPADVAPPGDLVEAAYIVRLAAARTVPLSAAERTSLANLIDKAKAADPRNAYWDQVEAAMLHDRGMTEEARRAWRRGATKLQWNDYQGPWLVARVDDIHRRGSVALSWHAASVSGWRSEAALTDISSYARDLLRQAPLDEDRGLATRMEVLRNAALLRDGARWIAGSQVGVLLVERASQPQRLGQESRYRRLYVARLELMEALKARGRGADAAAAGRIFQDNDAWSAQFGSGSNWTELRRASMLTATLPLACMVAGAAGIVLWLCSLPFVRRNVYAPQLDPLVAGVGALGVGLLAWSLTRNPLVIVATVAPIAFLALGPKHTRSRPPESLGPLFALTTFLVGVIASLCLILGASTSQAAARVLGPESPLAPETLLDPGAWLGLALLALCALAIASPLYAFAQRIETPRVLAEGVRRAGLVMAFVGIIGAAIGTPFAYTLDRDAAEQWEQILRNEPGYAMLRR